MKQIKTKYRIKISAQAEYGTQYVTEVDVYPNAVDFGKISKDNVLGCVYYPAGGFGENEHVCLYYNENGYSEKDLRKSGYSIVLSIKEIQIFEEEKELYKNKLL